MVRNILDALAGQDLLKHRAECLSKGMKTSEIVREAGYVSLRNDGTERVHYTAYYQELLYVQGKLAKVRVTVTDTFGRQPNFSWADRYSEYIYPNENVVRKVKKLIGYTGVKCNKTDLGSSIHLHPRGENVVIMIDYV